MAFDQREFLYENDPRSVPDFLQKSYDHADVTLTKTSCRATTRVSSEVRYTASFTPFSPRNSAIRFYV